MFIVTWLSCFANALMMCLAIPSIVFICAYIRTGLGAIAAAVMSSTDSAILGSSSMFTNHIYRRARYLILRLISVCKAKANTAATSEANTATLTKVCISQCACINLFILSSFNSPTHDFMSRWGTVSRVYSLLC